MQLSSDVAALHDQHGPPALPDEAHGDAAEVRAYDRAMSARPDDDQAGVAFVRDLDDAFDRRADLCHGFCLEPGFAGQLRSGSGSLLGRGIDAGGVE